MDQRQSQVGYSCHYSIFRDGEQYVRSHSLGMIISGVMELNDGERQAKLEKGQLYCARKHHLLKFVKRPLNGQEYKSVSIYFDEQVLRDVSLEYGFKPEGAAQNAAFTLLRQDDSITAFMQSLIGYEAHFNDGHYSEVLRLKQKEGLLLLLHHEPELKNYLFDFSGPARLDLEAFMQKHFHFNVPLERFAFLTGRSLSTFKRDFERIFGTTPSRWLLRRRLQEAYDLIRDKGRTASDIYLELGFEDLSHFSFSFKKAFGEAPSRMSK